MTPPMTEKTVLVEYCILAGSAFTLASTWRAFLFPFSRLTLILSPLLVFSPSTSPLICSPVVSFLVTEHFEGPLLHTVVIGVHQMVIDVQVEQTVSLAVSTIEFDGDIDALASGHGEDSFHVLNSDAQLSSLHSVGGILVLETDVNTKQIE